MGSLAQKMQHEIEMDQPSTVADYLEHQMAHKKDAASDMQGRAGFLGFGRGGKSGRIKTKLPADDDEESEKLLEENLWRYYRLLAPHGRFKQRWDPYIQLLTMYNCIFIPMSLAFGYVMDDAHLVIDYAVDAFFAIDMLLSMSTVYYNDHYELVIDRRKIIAHYLRTWFVVDLLSILPLELFAVVYNAYSTGDRMDAAVLSNFLKLPRMLRLARFRKRMASRSGANLFRMLWLCLLFVFSAHLVACAWWAIGRLGADLEWGTDGHSTSWIIRAGLNSTAATTDRRLFGQQYVTALYWALTALLKTPSVGPDTPLEKIFATAVTILGVLVFTIFVGNTIEVLQTVSHFDEARRRQMESMSDFMRRAKLGRSMRRKIQAWSAAEYRTTLGMDSAALLHQFPRSLRGQIVVFMHRETIATCAFFQKLSSECTKALLMCVTPTVCLQKEILLGKGELCEFVYVLQRGALQLRDSPASDFESKEDDARIERGEVSRAVYRAVRRASAFGKQLLGMASSPLGSPSDSSRSSSSGSPLGRNSNGGRAATRKGGNNHFHVLEKPGSTVGLHDTQYTSVLYPYTIIASKTAALLRIAGTDIRAVLAAFGGDDETSGREHLINEFESLSVSMLRGDRKSRLASLQSAHALVQPSNASPQNAAAMLAGGSGVCGRASNVLGQQLAALILEGDQSDSPTLGDARTTPTRVQIAVPSEGGATVHAPGMAEQVGGAADASPACATSAAGRSCTSPSAGVGVPEQRSSQQQRKLCFSVDPSAPQPERGTPPNKRVGMPGNGGAGSSGASGGGVSGSGNGKGGEGASVLMRDDSPSAGIGRGIGPAHRRPPPSGAVGAEGAPATATEKAALALNTTKNERKNSLDVTAQQEMATRLEQQMASEAKAWADGMAELRSEMQQAGRKLQGVLTSVAGIEEELALLPQIAELLQALERVGDGKSGTRSSGGGCSLFGGLGGGDKPGSSPSPGVDVFGVGTGGGDSAEVGGSSALDPANAQEGGLFGAFTGLFKESPKQAPPVPSPPSPPGPPPEAATATSPTPKLPLDEAAGAVSYHPPKVAGSKMQSFTPGPISV